MRSLGVAILAFAASFAFVDTYAAPLTVVSDAAGKPPGVSHFVVHSERIGRDFEVWVNQPAATAFLPGQKFPVIYALDGGYGIAGPQGMLLGQTGAMSPAIIVSVGYEAGQAQWRNTDLMHNRFENPGPNPAGSGGGGAAFEAFMTEDLKPFIEARYPADSKRSVLFGHSLGGLFAANVFADRPDAFAAYVIGSASAWADKAVIGRVATAAKRAHGTRIYLAVGGAEDAVAMTLDDRMKKGYAGLAAALEGHPGVLLKTQVYTGESHLSYYPRLITDGFPFALPPARPLGAPQTPQSPTEAARYAGVYKLPDGRQLQIVHMPNGGMSAQVIGLPMTPLLPVGPDHFYAPSSDIDAMFDGQHLTMTAGGGAKLTIPRDTAPWAGPTPGPRVEAPRQRP